MSMATEEGVTISVESRPSLEELRAWRAQRGVTHVRLNGGTHELVADRPQSADLIRLLRDCASALLTVEWDGHVQLPSVRLLTHLSPPGGAAASSSKALWHELSSPFGLYVRHGPGFRLIRDRRAGGAAVNTTLDDPAEVAVYDRLAEVVDVTTVDSRDCELISDFVACGLAMSFGTKALALATRFGRWPVPSVAV
jgi:hypothetical protein